MTMIFNSLQTFAAHLDKTMFAQIASMQAGLEITAKIIEEDAKEEIGTYQRQNMGQFDPWAELADSTKADRVNQGYSENEPLLRSGAMRDSISHTIDGLDAYIGSPSLIMLWQELGTATIPPRSVLGLAASRNKYNIIKELGILNFEVLIGRSVVNII